MFWFLRLSSGLFLNFLVIMKCRKDATPPQAHCCWTYLNRICICLCQCKGKSNISQLFLQFKLLFISLHSKPLLLSTMFLFALFPLFYSSCIISHLHNFWRTRIWLINLNNKDRPLKETHRQPLHRLNWMGLGCLCQQRFPVCSCLRTVVLLIMS